MRERVTRPSGRKPRPACGEAGSGRSPETGEGGHANVPRPRATAASTFDGVRLTHPDRVLYPDQGITKLALARYYAAIGDWMRCRSCGTGR